MATPATSVRTPVGGVLTPGVERAIRVGSIGTAGVIALSAMVLSYAGLNDLAREARINPHLSLLVPVMVDGLQFVGSLGVVYSTLSGLKSWYPWTLMLLGVSVSAWGNWQAAPDVMTAKLLHGAAPVILALVLEELLRVMRHKVQLHTEAKNARTEISDAKPRVPAPTPTRGRTGSHGDSSMWSITTVTPDMPRPEPDQQGAAVPNVPRPGPSLSEPAAPDRGNAGRTVSHDERPEPTDARPVPDTVDATVPGQDLPPGSQYQSNQSGEPVVPSEGAPSTQDNQEAPQVEAGARDVPSPQPAPSTPPTVVPSHESLSGPGTAGTARPSGGSTPPVQPEAGGPVAGVSQHQNGRSRWDDQTLPPYPADGSLKDKVRAILVADPSTAPAKISRLLRSDPSYTRKLVREVRDELEADRQHQEHTQHSPSGSSNMATSAPRTMTPQLVPQPLGVGGAVDPFATRA